jgi:hypothetical protein
MIEKIKYLVKNFVTLPLSINSLERNSLKELNDSKHLTAKILINLIKQNGIYENIHQAEFKVSSQFGEDGIIQYLVNNISIDNKFFVEFGVEDYKEANTRFLLVNNNWSGLVLDGNDNNICKLQQETIYWQHDLTAVAAFLDRDNINCIIGQNVSGEIGILSIDVDGNDYWIWKNITIVDPIIVICEYNSLLGNKYALTIPYDPLFVRGRSHFSHLYWGCSLKALCLLAEEKGYYFVGSNSHGHNAFFVRKDKVGSIKCQNVETGYITSKYRESRNEQGQLSFIGGNNRLGLIEDMDIYNLESGEILKIRDLGDLSI